MSRNNRRRRHEVAATVVKEMEYVPAPARRMSLRRRIESFIMDGDQDGIDALHELFPIPASKSQAVWGERAPRA